MYADKITDSMRITIDETERRRKKQIEYNYKNGITPKQAGKKALLKPNEHGIEVSYNGKLVMTYVDNDSYTAAADPVVQYMSKDELKKQITKLKTAMLRASKEMDFMEAARLRDEMYSLEKLFNEA
jgi:excinuclease ABC subunit B